ncbi:tetratricopeptide repeat protein [Draconibacterium sp. IB214405]|uniref:helix-turn-helix domain-containing protein n=1 Tax=Draconibacterium sp. IB214405 TaxID=3097352 RepID=UPI002A1105BD|nr:helix-turn-helix domain-containing protein [Draconibacterium sp. IB214405]MDX8340432.1 tetratricopeptide repeat protein [Draconibacterium sp. IB214405]
MDANPQHNNPLNQKKDKIPLSQKLEEEVEKNLNNENFGVELLAQALGMSRSGLHRNLQKHTGQSISQFIREYRLKRGLEYLKNGEFTVSEVAYKVGFNSPSYFTSCFTDYFGYAPSAVKYRQENVLLDNGSSISHSKANPSKHRIRIIASSVVLISLLLISYVLWPVFNKTAVDAKESPDQGMTQNPEAYDLYLKGEHLRRIYTPSSLDESIEYFNKAIALDSSFALAYAGIAQTLISKACIFDASLHPLESFKQVRPLLEKAEDLEPGMIQVHILKGFIHVFGDWDFEKAEEEYQKAIVTNYPEALGVYIDLLNFVQKHELALEMSNRLNRNHPHYPNSRMILTLCFLGEYEKAEEFASERLKIFNNYFTLDNSGFLYLNTGQYAKAISLFQQAIDMEGIRYPRMLGWMGAAYAKLGDTEKVMALLQELKDKKDEGFSGSYAFFVAVIYASLGDTASALEWLEISYQHHDMEIPWLLTEPQFLPLHNEPAFQELVRKVGFSNPKYSS